MTSRPPRATTVPPAERANIEARIAVLRAEGEVDPAPGRKAVLQHQVGHLYESQLGDDAAAVREYLGAFNLDPTFRAPLFALIRIFERRRSFKNLPRLYDAEARAAETELDRASALVDLAFFAEARQGDAEGSAQHLAEAQQVAPELGVAHLARLRLLERQGEASTSVTDSLAALAASAHAPEIKAALWFAAAQRARAEDADLESTGALLRKALAIPGSRYRALTELESLARQHGKARLLVESLELRGRIAETVAEGEPSEEIAVDFETPEEARSVAAALYYESARTQHGARRDPVGARNSLERALALCPDSLLLRFEHLLSCELAGDLDAAAEAATSLLAQGVSGPHAAPLHFQLAERALAAGELEAARDSLGAARAADPASAAAAAILDDLLLDLGAHQDRVLRMEEQAAGLEGHAAAQALWRAGQVALERLHDLPAAAQHYRSAAEHSEHPAQVWRELLGAALRVGHAALATEAGEQLLKLPIDDAERSAVRYQLVQVAGDDLAEGSALEAALRGALQDPAASLWAPAVCRLRAAAAQHHDLLAHAHRALADVAATDHEREVHRCAAARALCHTGDIEAATAELRQVLVRSPAHPYAVGLLEELLRGRGDAEQVVALLRASADAQAGVTAGVMPLLQAGAAAEACGDAAQAAESYEQAVDRDPTARTPLLALERLAIRQRDDMLRLRTLEALSERELAEGEASRATLELGEHYAWVSRAPRLAEASLSRALGAEGLATPAALALAILPVDEVEPGTRRAALQHLLLAGPDLARTELRRMLGDELALQADSELQSVLSEQRDQTDEDLWANLLRVYSQASGGGSDEEREEAIAELARGTTATGAGADLALHGLRSVLFGGREDAADDAFMIAQEIDSVAHGSPAAAVALDETLSAGDDPEARVHALTARLAHASPETSGSLRAAQGRALLAARAAEEASQQLRTVLEQDPDDLASWEALRVAARGHGAFPEVVTACDKLAEVARGEHRAQLLEESAAVLMDELGEAAAAVERLQAALKDDVTRPVAYGRLHDLLAEGDDPHPLLALVVRRTDAEDDPNELERLFYEQARLQRSLGEREQALSTLDQLFDLTPDHVGGLALAVEIQVSLGRYREAVENLRALASADVPPTQKRLARLGAADFLERKLDDPAGSIAELRHIVELGLADAELYRRIARVADHASMHTESVEALELAAAHSSGAVRAALEREAGAMHAEVRLDAEAAMRAYRRALNAEPTDVDAAEAIAELLGDDDDPLAVLADEFEDAVWDALGDDPTRAELLRKLLPVAAWRGDADLELRILDSLDALGHATSDDREALREAREEIPGGPSGRVSLESMSGRLRAPGTSAAARDLLLALAPTFTEHDNLSASAFGVGRGELVGRREPHPVHKEIEALAALLDVPTQDVYVGGPHPAGIAAFPTKKGPAWVVGTTVTTPLSPRWAFRVGQLTMGLGDGSLFALRRGESEGVALVLAACLAAEAPLHVGAPDAQVSTLAAKLGRDIPRRIRKEIPGLVAQIAGGHKELARHYHAALATLDRAGLVYCGQLGVALEALLGKDGASAAASSPRARELIRFWLSDDAGAIRAELGVAL